MFTQPSVNQIASTYQGNPQPLAQKVEADKKQHGGIPQDLRQLLALNDITQGRNAMGIQQALQIPTNMPTVAQSLQQQAQQAIQARLMEQAREQQRLQQKPPTLPLGTPQPRRQPQGIDALETNVGEEYAHGGIIGNVQHFDGKTTSMVVDPMLGTAQDMTPPSDDLTFLERIGVFNPENRRANEKLERELRLRAQQGNKPSEVERGRLRDPRASQFNIPDIADQVAASKREETPAATKERVNVRDNAPMPAGERPAAGLDAYLATPEKNLAKAMNVDPESVIKGGIDMYNKYVGSPSTVGIDRMIEEVNRRKAKLEGQTPKPGFEGVMDYLENIANAGGRRWYESGTKGAALQKANQKAREEQINALLEKGIDLLQKKEDVAYGVKKEGFGVGLKEMQDAVKRKYDAAIALEQNILKREELKQQRDLELRKISAMHVNPALQIAAALQNAKTPEQREFITQGIASVYGNRSTGTDAAILRDYETAVTKARDAYKDDIRKYGTAAEKAALKADIERDIAIINKRYEKYGVTGQGGGASTTTAVPLPPDARTNPDKLVVGTIYQTAQGPGKWNGKGFEPQ